MHDLVGIVVYLAEANLRRGVYHVSNGLNVGTQGASLTGTEAINGAVHATLSNQPESTSSVLAVDIIPNLISFGAREVLMRKELADGLRDVMSCECRILVGSMVPWKYGECVKRLERIRRIYSVRNMPIVSVTWQEKRAKCMEREFELRAYKAPMEENPFEMKGSVIKILRQVVT